MAGSASLLEVARGRAPATVVLRNLRLVNVLSGAVEEAEIALAGDRVAAVGRGHAGVEEVDLGGAFVAPGLIDAHVHLESSLCVPSSFAEALLPHGVTTVVADPHEIANVAGAAGVRFLRETSLGLPLSVVLMAPSCVPASHLASSGARLGAAELAELLAEGVVHGLGEVMNVPGVLHGDPEVHAKLAAFAGRPRDGHAPGLTGPDLDAYVAVGPGSDHECTGLEEAAEKLSRGMAVFMREASGARNLGDLLPLVTPSTERRICLCTDDRHPAELVEEGSVDAMLRAVVASGVDPVVALRLATLNPAEHFGLHDRGAVAPGRRADLVVFDDLRHPVARQVWAGGSLVAQGGKVVDAPWLQPAPVPAGLAGSVHVAWGSLGLAIPARGREARVIGVRPGQVLTRHLVLDVTEQAGLAVADPWRDISKLAVVERHRASGRVGLGFVHGMGLQRGALASTVAHDHHNLVVVGADDASMLTAARAVAGLGGGMAVVVGEEVLASLPLPVGGLMSERPVAEVCRAHRQLTAAARSLGTRLDDPFMTLSFLGLEVIPELKLTDLGLVDVASFELVDLFP